MASSSSSPKNYDLLRPGVFLSNRYKLLERIPRWVAQRRMRAQSINGEKTTQLLFFDSSPEEIEAFALSIKSLAGLQQPNILPLLSAEILKDFPAITAKFIDGPTLREHLDHEGPLPPEEARQIFASILEATRCIASRGLPVPAILPETILLSPSKDRRTPVLFPLVLPSFPPPPANGIARTFRDFLFEITTNQPPPANYETAVIHRLPPPARKPWQALFVPEPEESLLQTIAETPIDSAPLAPISADAAIRSSQENSQPSATSTKSTISTPSEPRLAERSPSFSLPASAVPPPNASLSKPTTSKQKKRSSSNGDPRFFPAVSAVAALATAAFVGWFCWSAIEAIAPHPPPPSSLPLAQQNHQNALTATPSQLRALDEMPQDAKDKPGSAMEEWAVYHKKYSDNPAVNSAFIAYLAGMEPHIPALRRGQMPAAFSALEKTADGGFAPARFLLAQVLWGKETQRSERLMIDLARNGYAPSREWCETRLIDWKP